MSDYMKPSYMCLVQYVLDGTHMYGIPFIWHADSTEEAATQAARLAMWPGAQRHRITVVPFEHSESFRWLGEGEVQSERA